ncbi:hypothetical protein [Chryseobacterium luquanense]|uniref:GLPGLI family protein n=1 Tax=Chryseobacterium luquanense TaxID=2983766 RepID=A0ABT3XZE7_9FLAO|nr:hypothetical protein [Chryseobacterium luquanense]MCX8531226.1 hypothetical protein [Chryseobacterium luquanense]
MRKIILLLTCFLGITAFSQIKVLKNETLIEIGKDNSVGLYKKENKFTFNYQDINTSNLNTFRSFSFNDINGDVHELYKMITDGFIDAPSGNISLELPNDIIELQYEKNYGQPTVQIIQYINKNKKYVGKSQFLNKKQIDKIFGIGTPKAGLYKVAAKQTSANPISNNNTVQTQANTVQQNNAVPTTKTPVKPTKKRK